jgi:AcrR family transcriptional regulator
MHRIEVDNPKIPPQLQLRAQVIDALEYVVQDRPLAMLLLSAGHTPDAEAAERLDQFFAEVRDLLRRAFESGQEIKLLRKVQPELLAAAMLGMIRGVVEMIITQPDAPKVEQVVDELLTVALRGVLA